MVGSGVDKEGRVARSFSGQVFTLVLRLAKPYPELCGLSWVYYLGTKYIHRLQQRFMPAVITYVETFSFKFLDRCIDAPTAN